MAIEATGIWSAAWLVLGALLFVRGGLRFRRWAVEDRVGIPRFSIHTETIMIWLVYSAVVAVAIVVVKQVLREL
ncbi:MAG: hypothetical protein ACX98W_19815 [bacterium]